MPPVGHYKNPVPTVDIIIELGDGRIVLIKRKNPPYGWALPGGFVDYGESLEAAAIREAKEETMLDVTLIRQMNTYSQPDRDPRGHTISTVFIAQAQGTPRAADDAQEIGVFDCPDLPFPLAFDHAQILTDYIKQRKIEKGRKSISEEPATGRHPGGSGGPEIKSDLEILDSDFGRNDEKQNRTPFRPVINPRETEERIKKVLLILKNRIPSDTTIGIILGTGLGGIGEKLQHPSSLSYQTLPFFPQSTVESHPGKLVWGKLAGKNVVVLQGRFHLYEGYAPEEIGFPIRVLGALGIRTLIIANAAGGLDPKFQPGDILLITDQINFTGENPLIGPHLETWGPRFPDMSQVYHPKLKELAEKVAQEQHLLLRQGVYVGVKGPCLETPAETRFLISMGAQAVGMSTIMETIVAVQAGIDLLGFSVITNVNRPDNPESVSLASVIQTALGAESKLAALIEGVLEKLD
jgi:purine-nucleoside phosphorylase